VSDVRFLVQRYLNEGFGRPHPIPRGEKGPRIKGWNDPEVKFAVEDFGETDNVGTALTGDLVDIDLDCMEAVKAAHRFLPTTGRIHGRPGKPSSHYWYRVEGMKLEQFRDVPRPDGDGKPKVGMLCEIRTGPTYQTVLPPSLHGASGETLTWEADREASSVDGKTLRRAVLLTAVTALIVRSWPKSGRHQALLDLTGFLYRQKIDAKECIEILSEITLQAEGEVWKDCESSVRSTYSKTPAEGAKTTGGPALEKIFGKDVVERLRAWFGAGRSAEEKFEAIVEEMNAKHFYVTIGADTVIGTEKADKVVFQSERAMYAWYANQKVALGTRQIAKGPRKGETEVETRSKFEIWREHPKRRQFRSVVFAPPPHAAHPEDLNLWKGLAIEPAPGDCTLFLDHLLNNICSGNQSYYEYLMDWCALLVQRPGVPADVAVVLRGGQGVGKGIFARNLGRIFGRHFAHLDKVDHLTGHFNAHLSGKVLVFADEAFFAGDKKELGALKRVITEPTLTVTRKRIDSEEEANFCHIVMATNEHWSCPADMDERRFFALLVGNARKQDIEYFTKVQQQLDAGGLQAFLDLLLRRPVDPARVRRAPKTEEYRVQQELTLSNEHKWWFEKLSTGKLEAGIVEDGPDWPELMVTSLAHEDYLGWCERQRIFRRLTTMELAKRILRDYFAGPAERPRLGKLRAMAYPLVPLTRAREIFDKQVGTKGDWEDVETPTPAPPAPGAPRGPKAEPRLPLADPRPVEREPGDEQEGLGEPAVLGRVAGSEGGRGTDTPERAEGDVGRQPGAEEDEELPF
jgi:hypothetical protein